MEILRILSTLAVKGAFAELAERFQAASGIRVEADFAPTLALLDRLRGGEPADVVILTREGRPRASGYLERRCVAHYACSGPRGGLFAHWRQRHPVCRTDRAARDRPHRQRPSRYHSVGPDRR